MSSNPKEKILVIKLGALGDFIQALGPMAAIRKHHPDADITLLTTSPFVSFGLQCGYFDHVWDHQRPKWKNILEWVNLRKKLNADGYQRVYDLQNNDRTSIYFRLFSASRKPEWVGIAKGASHRNTSKERTAGTALAGHIQTLTLAGIKNIEVDPMDWVEQDISGFGLKNPYVLLVPGSAPQHLYKRWPEKKYAHLARLIYGWGYDPVIIGTSEEKDIAQHIRESFPHIIDLTGQTTLFDIVVLGRNAAAAIGNDTGPMHLIAPTGCPSRVLFSKHTDPARHLPQGPNVQFLQEDDLEDLSAERVMQSMRARDFRYAGIEKKNV